MKQVIKSSGKDPNPRVFQRPENSKDARVCRLPGKGSQCDDGAIAKVLPSRSVMKKGERKPSALVEKIA